MFVNGVLLTKNVTITYSMVTFCTNPETPYSTRIELIFNAKPKFEQWKRTFCLYQE